MEPLILTVNTGSSSLKTALYDARDPLERVAGFDVSRVGRDDATVTQRDGAIESSATASGSNGACSSVSFGVSRLAPASPSIRHLLCYVSC